MYWKDRLEFVVVVWFDDAFAVNPESGVWPRSHQVGSLFVDRFALQKHFEESVAKGEFEFIEVEVVVDGVKETLLIEDATRCQRVGMWMEIQEISEGLRRGEKGWDRIF